ncbi:DUF3971 domain-containing protein [Novipirellula aureliae]|uniref:DUF3971 domain-containing protein n=1 Tax=Novipirellula aureliae TaxID=2527966 RepID=UPI0011B5A8E0|nr:DUF3971 domain-containing protein [Novipirellula aureliae]
MSPSRAAPQDAKSSFLSKWLWAALILTAIVFTARMLAPDTIGEQARRHFLKALQNHYASQGVTEIEISIRRGRFEPQVGLVFDDLLITDRSATSRPLREMISVKRMIVFANVHPEKLFDKEIPLTTTRIALTGIDANITVSDDAIASIGRLLPLPKFGPVCPRIDVRDAKIHLYGNDTSRRPITTELTNISLLNRPQLDGSIDQVITVSGSADYADGINAEIKKTKATHDIRCTVRNLRIEQRLFDNLPLAFQEPLLESRGLDCICDLSIAALLCDGKKPNFAVRTTIHEGSFHHPKLPKPITQLHGVVSATPKQIHIEASQATFGDALVRANGRIHGYQMPCDADLRISIAGLLLDASFANSLTTKMREAWNKLQPYGRVDVNADVICRDGIWDTSGIVNCKGVDVQYEKFPYPVQNVVGQIEIQNGIASSDSVTGRIDSHRLRCMFRLPIRPGITNEKTFVAAADGSIAIDSTLINALSHRGVTQSKLESFVRTLRPRGRIHLASVTIGTDAAGRTTRQLDLRVQDGHLRYEKFAYPLYNVEGQIEIEDDLVRLVGFRGMSANSGVVLCNGTYQIPKPSTAESNLFRITSSDNSLVNPKQLQLDFQVSTIPMDESLRLSLPESAQRIWDSIAPGGVLDEAEVSISMQQNGDPIEVDLTARQFASSQVNNRSLSMRPCSLPYRIDISGGTVRYDGSTVRIDSLRGQHGASRLTADGICVRGPSGRWELSLNLKEGSRLLPDAELIGALPGAMREAMRRLQLRGPLSIRGATKLTLPDRFHSEPDFNWDVTLQLEGNRIADVGPVHSLRGEIKVNGQRDEDGIRAAGEVAIDSMHINDLQITAIRGPFQVVDDRLDFGLAAIANDAISNAAWVNAPLNTSAYDPRSLSKRPMMGRVFDGTLEMKGDLLLSSGNFNVDFTLRNASVPTLLADLGHSNNGLSGVLSGHAAFAGSLGTMDFLKGNGDAKISGANVYQLPFIMQVLNQLRIRPSEDVAFTDGSVDFTIFGDLITFNDLRLWGDWVALQGTGTLDGRRELDLTFNTRVSPQNVFTSVVRPLRGDRYTLWTMDVRGPVHSPTIERRAFEGMGETLEWLFPNMNAQANASANLDTDQEKRSPPPTAANSSTMPEATKPRAAQSERKSWFQ